MSRGELRAHVPGRLKTLGHGLEVLRADDGRYSYRCTCSFACSYAWATRSEALGNYYIHRLVVHHIPVPDGVMRPGVDGGSTEPRAHQISRWLQRVEMD